MLIKAGFNLTYLFPKPTPLLLVLNIHPSRRTDLIGRQELAFSQPVSASEYTDGFGNRCTRLTAPAGSLKISTLFEIRDSGLPDVIPHDAEQHDIADLPDNVLVYLLGSRYCDTDRLANLAWSLFQGGQTGWPRVQAILDFVHNHITFDYMSADAMRSAHDAYADRRGVCRDYTHLAIAFCRAMNIPARYCTGYLGDIEVPPTTAPMDFSAWFEVYLGGQWHTADARNNTPRVGRILMAIGRDATDVALSTQFGPATMTAFEVITDEMPEPAFADGQGR
jgi:transglutaminase-like putative cysteine protease